MKRQFEIGPADLEPGQRRIIEVDGKSIGLFNVNGAYYALLNRCPHMAGKLCEGPVTGTTLYARPANYKYGRKNELIRCGWHGWEFEIESGRCLVDDRMRARKYPVTQKDGQLILHI